MQAIYNWWYPEPSYFQGLYNKITSSEIGAAVSQKVSNFANSGHEFIGRIKDKLERSNLGGVVTTISYGGAAIGGLMVVDSTINLLQKKADDNLLMPKKEAGAGSQVLKILAGSALIASGLAFGANSLERSKILNVALGFGLINAAWRAAIVVKPTFLVFQLKSVESNEPVKNVAVFPE